MNHPELTSNKTVIIAGGRGFLGRKITAQLVHSGYNVCVLTRSPAPAEEPAEMRVSKVHWDLDPAHAWAERLNGASALINLAGEDLGRGWWTSAKKERLVASRIQSTRALVQALLRAKQRPEVFVNASAIGYYGNRGDETLDESASAGDDFLGRLCMQWEQEAAAAAPGVRVVLARVGIVLAIDGGALPRMLPAFRLFAGGPVASGRQWMSWIHWADVAGSFQYLLENKQITGPVNITAPEPVRNREFSRALGKALRRPAVFPVPAMLLKLLFGEKSQLVLYGQKVLPRKLLDAGYKFKYAAIDDALQAVLHKA